MLLGPKDDSRLIPVDDVRLYEEVCGDVTRFIIRVFGEINVLKLCPLQMDRTYAIDWPIANWSTVRSQSKARK
ncbi:hypothetical protein PG997_011689 [Apiospora hydei]|uniref:Uncharacterized protein n=1 Tax=Apiospora hydei TaxID=1337664 RepID=A0ABR1VJQ9_9PEZI